MLQGFLQFLTVLLSVVLVVQLKVRCHPSVRSYAIGGIGSNTQASFSQRAAAAATVVTAQLKGYQNSQ
jgi:hypothetical protein